MKRKITPHMLTTMALLVALMIVLTRILGIETQFIRISFSFVPKMVMGMLFGPFWTGIGAAIADIIGITMFPKGAPFFPGFTLNAFLGGVIYGFYFYKKEITWKNAILCTVTVTLLIDLLLTPIWLSMMFNVPLTSWAIWAPRLLKAAIMLPIQASLFYIVGRALPMKRLTKNLKIPV